MPFPATIIQRAYAQVPTKVIQLAGANWVRPLYFGTGWSRIRIGALISIYDTFNATIPNAILHMGLCSGTDAPVGNTWTRSFIGACLTGTVNGTCTLTRTAGTSGIYWAGAAPTGFRKIENNVYPTATGTLGYFGATEAVNPGANAGQFAPRRTPVYVDITRTVGGGNTLATISFYGPPAAQAAAQDYRPNDFLAGLDYPGVPNIYGLAMTAWLNAVATVYVGEGAGPLDTVNIYWNRTSNPLEIHAVGVSIAYESTWGSSVNAWGADSFTQYGSGTMSGQNLNQGSGWSGSPWSLSTFGTNRGNPAIMQAPSAGTYPFFGSVPSTGTMTGTYWKSYGSVVPALYQGTVVGWPIDSFEAYAFGSITSGVTVSAGSGWSSPALILGSFGS